MFRTISHLRSSLPPKISLPQALRHFSLFSISPPPTPTQSNHLPVNPSPSTPLSLFHSLSSPCSSLLLQKHQDGSEDDFNTDPKSPPRLFVVQPRFRPDSILNPKLDEALNLANSLEEQRDGFYDTEFLNKQMPPHLVVQNPAARSIRAGTLFCTVFPSCLVMCLMILCVLAELLCFNFKPVGVSYFICFFLEYECQNA